MSESDSIVHSRTLAAEQSGELLHLSREKARWEWMSFAVRRLSPGDEYHTLTENEEATFVILGGKCRANWGAGMHSLGKRKDVFDGFPYTLYLPRETKLPLSRSRPARLQSAGFPRRQVWNLS